MSSQVKTGWVCIATAGPTLDGRTITPECLRQMAEVYDPGFYTARLWPEGARTRPLGSVDALKVQEDAGQLKLMAILCPTLELIDLNTSGSHGFCTIEAAENFAGTGQWYLAGVSVTDQPTITGLTQLQFSAKRPEARPLLVPAPLPVPAKPANRTPDPDRMFKQLETLLSDIDSINKKLASMMPCPPDPPTADHHDHSDSANTYRLY
ncbi:GPO family capsid scaffolding protein [Aeromonas hydrophila]|uniref:GPO family capsid scaffolding protein n=1 Tax=Aeromonas hydrophila TaxID=644 RepID=UPI00214E7736|nr:GPO family capsid scaffolding protein [Aeromonas hydrophila]MCR3953549.1 GPO family capsid scaffolding protein [Aeromonas hydrophila]MCW4616368.1 GPO family capsid scaffolding protein [Aeromonas hydrophila]